MNVMYRPPVDRFSASSDFDEKLVTSRRSEIASELIQRPDGVSWSR